MDSISSVSNSMYTYPVSTGAPAPDASTTSAPDPGPAARLELSAVRLQGQMVNTLLASLGPVGQNVDALA